MICKVSECGQGVCAQGLCRKHYRKARLEGTIEIKSKHGGCKAPECPKPHYAKGFCDEHYWLQKNSGGLVRTRARSGSVKRANGYRFVGVDGKMVPEHRHLMEIHLRRPLQKNEVISHKNGDPSDNRLDNLELYVPGTGGYVAWNGYRILHKGGYDIPEHRYIMEQILGRQLRAGENVHHKNGDRLDNRPENLELWSCHQPSGQRVVDKVQWAREILRQYETDLEILMQLDR